MEGSEIVSLVSGLVGLCASAVTAYFVYKGSDKASQRTEKVQTAANSVDGFDRLTKAQEAAVRSAMERAADSDARAQRAETEARASRKAAEQSAEIAEDCREQVRVLTTAYRQLHAWASQPCPHKHPPPDPPSSLALS